MKKSMYRKMKVGIPSFVFYSAAFLILMIIVFSFLGNNTFFNIAQAHTATIPVGIGPFGIAYNPSNNNIYVANAASSTVSVISGSTNSVIATPLVGRAPFWLVYVPNNQIYVTNGESNDVYVINAATNRVVKSIAVGTEPSGMAYDPTNNSVYVTNSANNTVSVINAATDIVVSTIPLGSSSGSGSDSATPDSTRPVMLAYDNDNDGLYVSKEPFAVSIINAVTNAAVYDITVDRDPTGIAYNPTNHNMYVAKFSSNEVSVIDTITNSVIGNIPVGNIPVDIVYNPINHNMYVTNLDSNTLSVIDSTTNSVIGTIPAGSAPYGIAYDSTNNHIYVTNPNSNTVTMIHP